MTHDPDPVLFAVVLVVVFWTALVVLLGLLTTSCAPSGPWTPPAFTTGPFDEDGLYIETLADDWEGRAK